MGADLFLRYSFEANWRFVYGKEKPCRLGEITLFEDAKHFYDSKFLTLLGGASS